MTEMTTKVKTETGAQPDIASHDDLKSFVEEYVSTTGDARALGDRCRDYKDGRQWTADQVAALKRRRQAPIVNNRIKVKHNGLLGLVSVRKAEPKAFARNNQQDSGAAEACTDALRYVSERNNLPMVMLDVADNYFCEGYGGVQIVEAHNPMGEVDIIVDHIPAGRLFRDAYSIKRDFTDSRGQGYMMWMDEEDIMEAFPDADPAAFLTNDETMTSNDDAFTDKPSLSWTGQNGKRKRHLVATHYFRKRGTWYLAIYTGSGFLLPPMPSPYLDEYKQPECPIEMVSAYIDRDGQRKGELADFLDLQDEINHRRSKALFLLSQRQTFSNRGAVKDIKKMKKELSKADGHLEVGQGEFGKDFGLLPTGDMAQGQLALLQEAKAEIDAQSYNAQLAGQRQQGDLSGLAIGRLQQAGVTELNVLFLGLSSFRLRVYRKMWNRVRQFWDAEKWIRVTDDQKAPRYVGLNVEVKLGDYLKEIMDDESKPYAMRLGASAQLVQAEKQNPAALEQVIMIKNRAAELDMDIILDESFDTINASQEQLDAILKFGAQGQFDIIDLLEISNVQGKDRLIDKIQQRKKETAAATQNDPAMQLDAAKVAETLASTEVKKADALQRTAETHLILTTPNIPMKGSITT